MTIGELRAALAKIDAMHDSEIVSVLASRQSR